METNKTQTAAESDSVPAGAYDSKGGFRIDGNLVQFWGAKARAVAAAKAIRWPVKSVVKVHTRFQIGYAILSTFGGLLSREAYARKAAEWTISDDQKQL